MCCLFMYVHVGCMSMFACMQVHVHSQTTEELDVDVSPKSSPFYLLTQSFSLTLKLIYSSWSGKISSPRDSLLQAIEIRHQWPPCLPEFYVHYKDLNSSSNVYTASTLPTVPSPTPSMQVFPRTYWIQVIWYIVTKI